mmetsp:Transcript_10112/g.10201  ORF Transcript_10112/g.10201 Transcript_10112/m.10201 type:complete len:193 (-) Transcript_10112:118-696(-)
MAYSFRRLCGMVSYQREREEVRERERERERKRERSIESERDKYIKNEKKIIIKLYSNLIKKLFNHLNIIKLGYGLSNDMKRLQESYPTSSHYHTIQSVLDFTLFSLSSTTPHIISFKVSNRNISFSLSVTLALPSSLSLSLLCERVIGRSLDKRMQRSDWQKRPLLQSQIEYAALDALVLVMMFRELEKKET